VIQRPHCHERDGIRTTDAAAWSMECRPKGTPGYNFWIEGQRSVRAKRKESFTERKPGIKREIECLLYDSHQKGKMMIMIMKTPGFQVDFPVAEGNRKEGGGRKMRDLHKDI